MSLAAIIGIQLALVGSWRSGSRRGSGGGGPRRRGLRRSCRASCSSAASAWPSWTPSAAPRRTRRMPNPVPATVTSVDAGNRLYQANCAACHGVSGEGGGPLANTTPIQPPSLKAHLAQHTDGDLFYWITNGLPGGMPAWAGTLSETDRWNVINYLRAINQPVPRSSPRPSFPSASAAPTSAGPSADGSTGTLLAVLALPSAWSSLLVGLLSVRWRRRRR